MSNCRAKPGARMTGRNTNGSKVLETRASKSPSTGSHVPSACTAPPPFETRRVSSRTCSRFQEAFRPASSKVTPPHDTGAASRVPPREISRRSGSFHSRNGIVHSGSLPEAATASRTRELVPMSWRDHDCQSSAGRTVDRPRIPTSARRAASISRDLASTVPEAMTTPSSNRASRLVTEARPSTQSTRAPREPRRNPEARIGWSRLGSR